MAHIIRSIDALIDTIKQYHDKEKVDILFSAINGKPINEMMKTLSLIAHCSYATEFDFPKALRKEEIDDIENDEINIVDDYVEFIKNY